MRRIEQRDPTPQATAPNADDAKPQGDDIFINFEWGRSSSKQARKTVRSQAAQSSAASRKATIHAKRTGKYDELQRSRKSQEDISTDDGPSNSTSTRFKFVALTEVKKRGSDSAGHFSTRQLVKKTPLTGPRSPLGQGRVDLFQSLPISDVWHPSFAKLVDICKCCARLSRFFPV